MKQHTQRLILIALVLVLGVMLAACQPSAPTLPSAVGGAATEAPKPTEAATQAATENIIATPPASISVAVNLDPANATDADSLAVIGYIYEPLIGVDKGKTVPWLITSSTVAEDQLAYTLVLRTDVKFSDGSPLNAEVVIANFNRWFDPADSMHGGAAYKKWLEVFGGFKGEKDSNGKPKSAFDGIEKAGEYTVVIHLNRRVVDLESKLAAVAFSITKPSADGKSFLGTGAYMVTQKTDKSLVLEPNPNYTGPFKATEKLELPFKQ